LRKSCPRRPDRQARAREASRLGAVVHEDLSLPQALNILCTLALRGVLTKISPLIAARGLDFAASYMSTDALMRRIEGGEQADLAVLIDSAIETLIRQGKLAAGSRRDLARSAVGIAVAAGAPKPEIGTAEAFKQALLGARSVGYTRTGASGLHFAGVIKRLGIAEEIGRKAVVQDGVIGELAARGEVEIAVQQLSELALADGIDIVGPLPDELQKLTVFSAGVFAETSRTELADAFIAALLTPDVAAVMRKMGLEPITPVV
jgi:molybdate transport system substrate-binding protein